MNLSEAIGSLKTLAQLSQLNRIESSLKREEELAVDISGGLFVEDHKEGFDRLHDAVVYFAAAAAAGGAPVPVELLHELYHGENYNPFCSFGEVSVWHPRGVLWQVHENLLASDTSWNTVIQAWQDRETYHLAWFAGFPDMWTECKHPTTICLEHTPERHKTVITITGRPEAVKRRAGIASHSNLHFRAWRHRDVCPYCDGELRDRRGDFDPMPARRQKALEWAFGRYEAEITGPERDRWHGVYGVLGEAALWLTPEKAVEWLVKKVPGVKSLAEHHAPYILPK